MWWTWTDLKRALDRFDRWLAAKPPWWRFKERAEWKEKDPRKEWRGEYESRFYR